MNDPDHHITESPREALQPQLPVSLPLKEVRRETDNMFTLFFPYPDGEHLACFNPGDNVPGQFVMVWLPRINEKPFVISYLDDTAFGITVMVRGDFTEQLCNLDTGNLVGFRGPYGRGFDGYTSAGASGQPVVIGGGCGMAPLALLAERTPSAIVVQGAPTSSDLLYTDRFPDQLIYTEDGSAGQPGLPTLWLRDNAGRMNIETVYTCGPEPMLEAIVSICRRQNIPCQVALERYMKCGFGICGQCECDGRLVCQDGPVFTANELTNMPSFGRQRRDATGRRSLIQTDEECSA